MPSQADGSYFTYREIITQPAAWRPMLQDAELQASALRGHWHREKLQEILCIGCGSTHYLARTAAVTFQGVTGVPARAYPASELLLFPHIALSNSVGRMLLAISRSGETTETLKAMEAFRARDPGPILGVVCYPDTSLQRLTSLSLVAREAHEQSVAQTRSFTSMLIAVQALVFILAGRPLSRRFYELPELGAGVIEDGLPLAQQLGRDATLERFYFLGSGPFYGLACEAMLKMKEMSLSYSEAYHVLEFRHGPMSMVNRQTLIVGLLSTAALWHEVAVLKDMRALGGRVLAVTPTQLPPEAADYQIVLPQGLTDLERGALYLPALQLLAFYRSLHNGLNPDAPANLTAVVNLDI